MTLFETIKNFMEQKKDGVATLKEIYQAIDNSDYVSNSNTVYNSARAIIYRHKEDFKRMCKGVYLLKGKQSASLLIHGDGRQLTEIEDNSIDCIITDHPWEDKKAHRSGNQKNFAEYSTFRYTLDDFKAKARVLKPGAYLAEFLPVESSTNYEYLYEIKQLAKKCGLEYYTHCIWRNAPEGSINTGKTTKGIQQIVIFSKGKPKKLSKQNVNAYQTTNILNYEIEILLPNKNKHHQAEKPVALYEYLIRNFTEEHDICLDQFGGSCNMLLAAANTNRFAICYELAKEFVENAVHRFRLTCLYADEAFRETKNNLYEKTESTSNPVPLNNNCEISLF